MDLGLGFNGSLLDPMKMTDAELLDNGDDDDDVMNGVLLGSSSSVLQTPDKLSLEGQDDVAPGSNGGEGQMEGKNEAMSVAISNAINPGLEQLRSTAELEAKEVEIQTLRETNAKLIESGRELKDKLDLHEDELTDLREQFGAVEKENELKTNKVKSLEAMIESLEKKVGESSGAEEAVLRVKQLEEKIEKDKVDAQALQKRNQDAIGNKNQKIATLNEELGKLKEDIATREAAKKEHETKTAELEQNLVKAKESNDSLTIGVL